MQERLFGADHPSVGGTLNGLGALLYDAGDPDEAEPVLRRAIDIWRGLGEEGRARLSSALANLALVHHRPGGYEETERLHREALAIDREIYGEESAKVAADLNNLGWVYHDMGDLARAEEHYGRSLAMHRAVFGAEGPTAQPCRVREGFAHGGGIGE